MVVALAVIEFGCIFTVASLALVWGSHASPTSIGAFAPSMAIALACLACFYYSDLYDLRVVSGFRDSLGRLVPLFLVLISLMATVGVFSGAGALEPRALPLGLVAMAGLPVIVRATWSTMLQRPRFTQKVFLVGDSPIADKILAETGSRPPWRYSIDGRIIENGRPQNASSVPVIGNVEQAADLIERHRPDRVVTALSERRGRFPVESLLEPSFECVAFEDGVEFYERLTQKLAVESLKPSYLLYSRDFKRPHSQLYLRRAVSLFVASVGLLLSAPIMVLVALVIKIDSKGPVFFLQERAGLGAKTFQLIKFRTMRHDADNDSDTVWSRENGSKLTRVGRWLRPSRLDEIPQFINVLRGDMDLVGPRPEMASNISEMTQTIPYYGLRTMVRPGVTGWAQINMGYAVTRKEVTEKLRYDLYYVKHMSIGLDLRIILRTIKTVLSSKGT